MDRSCRLPATEEIDPAGEQRIEPGGQGEAHQDDQRQENEDHCQIGKLLQHVVALGRFAGGMLEAKMLDDRAADRAQFRSVWSEVAAEMAAADRIRDVTQTVDHEHPGEEEVPAPCHRQPAAVGNRQPRGEGTLDEIAVGSFGRAQDAGRHKIVAENGRDADRIALAILTRADLEQRRAPRVRRLAPIECRMRAEDVEPAQQQDRKRDDVDPVHQPHRQRVAVIQIASGSTGSGRSGWRIAR